MLHHIVYVLQIGNNRRQLYIGMTGLTAQERLDQHRRGYKSSSILRNKELSLRADLTPCGRYDYITAVRLERETRLGLAGRGYKVSGS